MIGMLSLQNRVAGLLFCAGLLFITLLLIRSNKLSAQYAVIWIIAELTMFVLLLFDPVSLAIMRLIGATNASSTIFLLGFVLVIGVILELLIRVSEFSSKLRVVNQELGLLRERFERLEESLTSQPASIESVEKDQFSESSVIPSG